MKINSIRYNSTRGFALVVSLVMMVLLSMLVVGLLQLSSISLRSASRMHPQQTAKSNALLAMQMAIGQLQRCAGPDQRITAPLSLAGSRSEENWCGVWAPGELDDDSLLPAVGSGESFDSAFHLSDRRSKMQRWKNDWLIEPLVTQGAADSASIEIGKQMDGKPVSVPLLGMEGGGLAWWIEDLSQRASLASGVNGEDAEEVGLAAAPRVDASQIGESDGWSTDFFKSSDERAKSLTLQSLALAGGGEAAGMDFPGAARSYGLFADPVHGGLKADLTRFVESDSTTVGAIPALGLAGIEGASSILEESFHEVTGPRWDRFRKWYQLSDSENSSSGGTLEASVPDQTRKAEVYNGEGYSVDFLESTELPLHPMVVDVGFHWDYTPETPSAEAILCHIYPRVTLWNPYNKPLKAGTYVIAMPKDIDSGGGLAVELEGSRGGASTIPLVIPGWGAQFRAEGEGSKYYLLFTLEATTFGPGECLVFTPKTGRQFAAVYDGRNPSSNVLTANQAVGPHNFYIRHQSQKPELAQRIARGERVKRYITTPMDQGNYSNAVHWNPKPFLLKASSSRGPTASVIMNSPNHPTLQRLYVNDGGGGEAYWAQPGRRAAYIRYYPDWNNTPSNNGSEWAPFSNNPYRQPPRNWYYRVHLSWIDDEVELAAVGRTGSPQPPYSSSVFADWNPMASVVCRTPSTYLREHFDLHVGPWYRCKAPHDALGPDQDWAIFLEERARGCPFGDPRDFAAGLSFPVIDIPDTDLPLQSIGSLRHAPLSPWMWHPLRVVGNSRPALHSDPDATSIPSLSETRNPWDKIVVQRDAVFNDLIQANDYRREVLLYDISYSVNRRLWDSFFASSWSADVPWDGVERLPNRQYVPHPTLLVSSKWREQAQADPDGLGLWLSAYLLVNEGAFNVNSISVEAWASVLGGLKGLSRTTQNSGKANGENPFARFRQPVSNDEQWGGGLGLSDDQLQSLAQSVVDVVRERGPFIGIADFVNRRLATDETAKRGSLDEALIRSGIVSSELMEYTAVQDSSDSKVGKNARTRDENASSWRLDGSAGFIEQGDLLEPLGGSLCARGDTFKIRATGLAYDKSGAIISRQTCEAVVVRSPEYLLKDSPDGTGKSREGNSALVAPMIVDSKDGTMTNNPELHPLNQRFGRRFEILSIKWLVDPSES